MAQLPFCITFLVGIGFLSNIIYAGEKREKSCITISLYDSFGDGWNGASLLFENSGITENLSPDCHENPKVIKNCYHESSGAFIFSMLPVNGEVPINYWEASTVFSILYNLASKINFSSDRFLGQ